MAGGMGRPGANIGAGVGAGLPQGGGRPMQAGPQQNAPMPVFNAPAISPMQQYMQSIGINRMPYNQRQFTPQPQPAPKSDNFAWAARVQPSSQQAQSANQPQQSELDKLRSELEEMRSRQAGTYTSGGGGGN